MPLKQPLKSGPSPSQPGKFILLGEDDMDDQELLKEAFATIDDSFSTIFVPNGRKVVTTLDSIPDKDLPCLIILDYNMPELNGAEILGELRKNKRYHSIPKIIWSTSGSETYKRICLELGACEYMTKPSNMTQLEESIRHMLSFCPA